MRILKIIVACLVLADVGYVLWARGAGKPPEAAPPAPPVATLKLASESRQTIRTAAAQAVAGESGGAEIPRAESGAASHTNIQRCISVGPFRDVSEAAHVAATLRGGGYDPRQRVAEGEVWAGLWVYLALPASPAERGQMLAKLKGGGIEDALEMPGPNDGSVVSLGLYGEPARAKTRVAQAQALGFNPVVADRKRTGNVYWIDIDLKPTDGMLDPADLQVETGRIVRLEVKGCPAPGAPSGPPDSPSGAP